jgi:hypothetical protein
LAEYDHAVARASVQQSWQESLTKADAACQGKPDLPAPYRDRIQKQYMTVKMVDTHVRPWAVIYLPTIRLALLLILIYNLLMLITDIRRIFAIRDRQQIEMMARKILTQNRSHAYMHELSQHADEFSNLLKTTAAENREYLALVYILAEHLTEIQSGACACSIIWKPMYNTPEPLNGILEVLDEKLADDHYSIYTHTRCLGCRKEFVSRSYESGFGQKVVWGNYRPTT